LTYRIANYFTLNNAIHLQSTQMRKNCIWLLFLQIMEKELLSSRLEKCKIDFPYLKKISLQLGVLRIKKRSSCNQPSSIVLCNLYDSTSV